MSGKSLHHTAKYMYMGHLFMTETGENVRNGYADVMKDCSLIHQIWTDNKKSTGRSIFETKHSASDIKIVRSDYTLQVGRA